MNRIAAITEIDMDNRTQDILHNIELDENYPDDYIYQGFALRDVRKKRRKAKDTKAITEPVVLWVSQNKKTINELEKLLGSVRKAEKKTVGRSYINRTDVMNGLLDKEAKA